MSKLRIPLSGLLTASLAVDKIHAAHQTQPKSTQGKYDEIAMITKLKTTLAGVMWLGSLPGAIVIDFDEVQALVGEGCHPGVAAAVQGIHKTNPYTKVWLALDGRPPTLFLVPDQVFTCKPIYEFLRDVYHGQSVNTVVQSIYGMDDLNVYVTAKVPGIASITGLVVAKTQQRVTFVAKNRIYAASIPRNLQDSFTNNRAIHHQDFLVAANLLEAMNTPDWTQWLPSYAIGFPSNHPVLMVQGTYAAIMKQMMDQDRMDEDVIGSTWYTDDKLAMRINIIRALEESRIYTLPEVIQRLRVVRSSSASLIGGFLSVEDLEKFDTTSGYIGTLDLIRIVQMFWDEINGDKLVDVLDKLDPTQATADSGNADLRLFRTWGITPYQLIAQIVKYAGYEHLAQIVTWFYSKQNAFFPEELTMLVEGLGVKYVPSTDELDSDLTRVHTLRRMEYDGVKLQSRFYGRKGVTPEYARLFERAKLYASTEDFVLALGNFPYRMPIGLFIERFNNGDLTPNEIHLMDFSLREAAEQGCGPNGLMWIPITPGNTHTLTKDRWEGLGQFDELELVGIEFEMTVPNSDQDRHFRYRVTCVRAPFTRSLTTTDSTSRICIVEGDLYLDPRMTFFANVDGLVSDGKEVSVASAALKALPAGVDGVAVTYRVKIDVNTAARTLHISTQTSASCKPDLYQGVPTKAHAGACVVGIALRKARS